MKKNMKKYIIVIGIILGLSIVGLTTFYFIKKPTSINPALIPEKVLVYHNLNEEIKLESPVLTTEAKTLPDKLVIEPGFYKINGQAYDLTREGLYRSLIMPEKNSQYIVYKNDTNALLSGLAWINSHGDRDDELEMGKLEIKAKNEKIITTCGTITRFAQYMLAKEKIESRIVRGVTKRELNGYDDSHILLEVKMGSNWQLYDLDNNAYFTQNGKILSYLEFFKAVNQNEDYQIEKIAVDAAVAVANFKDNTSNYDYSLYAEEIISSEIVLRSWYKDILNIALIQDKGIYYYYDTNQLRVQNFSKKAVQMETSSFNNKFYPVTK